VISNGGLLQFLGRKVQEPAAAGGMLGGRGHQVLGISVGVLLPASAERRKRGPGVATWPPWGVPAPPGRRGALASNEPATPVALGGPHCAEIRRRIHLSCRKRRAGRSTFCQKYTPAALEASRIRAIAAIAVGHVLLGLELAHQVAVEGGATGVYGASGDPRRGARGELARDPRLEARGNLREGLPHEGSPSI
jgi:hypothetical protein